ncbi:MAG: hypothetical protein QOJ00_322 [Actinomycetota bacterium]|jgi:hypothetical protein
MSKARVVMAVALIAVALASCKAGGKSSGLNAHTSADTSTTLSTDAASASGGATSTTASGGAPATVAGATDTTAITTKPDTDHLALPKPGDYTFRDSKSAGEGAGDRDTHFNLSVRGQVVRVQQTEIASTGPASYYEETHRREGLYLTNTVISGNSCAWFPSAASLPQSVIDGGKDTTKSTCSAQIGDTTYHFSLEINLAFKQLRTVVIAGTAYRCIDVTRHRVFTNADGSETVDATDTYAFKLGVRVATDEHVLAKSGTRSSDYLHRVVLTALPA